MSLTLSQEIYNQITEHLQAAYPNEGAGLLLGHANGGAAPIVAKMVSAILPFANKFESGEQYHRYLITAQDMLDGEKEAEKLGLDIVGIFHSHPDHPARASEYDREYALPWYSYLIVAVHQAQAVDVHVWVLADDRSKFVEQELRIEK
ncbi:MAG: M67 family metallopeptidase [Chloroflexi bacterium]|nr:M67 family metallopeptidase [Chloroflexota bacterium]